MSNSSTMLTTSKRILIFSTSYFPMFGGAEVAVREITDRLSDFEFDLICAKQRKDTLKIERIGNVTIYRIGFGYILLDKLLVPFLGAWKTLRLNREKHYTAFWGIMATFATGAAYIANWFQKKVPIILTLQEGDSEKWLRYRWLGILNLSWRLALGRTTILTAISNYLLERGQRLGFNGKAILIPNGVDINRFKNVQHPVLDKNSVTLITTSRLVEKNGVEDVIDALKFLPDNIKFKILGIGPLESRLKSQVKTLGLESRIEFLGLISQEDLPTHLHQTDIFIRPSLSEGMGNSFIEAMAAGLPVIATPVGGIPDFLKDPSNSSGQVATGLFCRVNDPKSIADKVMEYINNPELTSRIVENARRMVVEKYDWNLIAEDMRSKVFNALWK